MAEKMVEKMGSDQTYFESNPPFPLVNQTQAAINSGAFTSSAALRERVGVRGLFAPSPSGRGLGRGQTTFVASAADPHPSLPPAGEGANPVLPPLPLAGEGWGEGAVPAAPQKTLTPALSRKREREKE